MSAGDAAADAARQVIAASERETDNDWISVRIARRHLVALLARVGQAEAEAYVAGDLFEAANEDCKRLEAERDEARKAADGIIDAVSEWFAGDIPRPLASDYRFGLAMHVAAARSKDQP